MTECIWVRCVLGADDLCEKAGSAHVTWYPGQKQRKQSRRLICDARYVTCYPRAGVSHVTPRRACHMLVGLLEKDFDRLQESLDKLNSKI